MLIEQKHEMVQSAISYGTGGGLIGLAPLADAASAAQSWALILGCIVVAIRLIHDGIALYRYIKGKK